MKLIFAITLLFSVFAQAQNFDPIIHSLRVDPSYFYNDFAAGTTASAAAQAVVDKAKASGVNTLFVYGYNTIYGAFYKTKYPLLSVEAGYGVQNIFAEVLKAAKLQGLKVVGVLPINDFKKVWMNRPAWRVKKANLSDYRPTAESYLLSSYHPDFKNWYAGFVQDFLNRHPAIDGVEVVEGFVDYNWDGTPDYNPEATKSFQAQYPGAPLGGSQWLIHRAEGLTRLHGLFSQTVKAAGKKAFVVQTWSAASDGSLFQNADLRDGMGFDFEGILNLPQEQNFDYVMAEFMWQQWKSEYGTEVFTPEWTLEAAQKFIQTVGTRSAPIIHVEISPFSGANSTVTPTMDELYRSITSVKSQNISLDIYDYHQISDQNAWNILTQAWVN